MKLLFWVGFIIFAFWQFWGGGAKVSTGPGVMISQAPIQTKIEEPQRFSHQDYVITPLAEFDIKAKVLSRENYYLGRESDLSPVDFALGWQSMSDESVLEHIKIRQSGRWYFWRVEQFPIPRQAIETQSANMHMIPADKYVEKKLAAIKQGQLISLKGFLIRADGSDGWFWQSSLTRNDTGNHACEVVYVQDVELL